MKTLHDIKESILQVTTEQPPGWKKLLQRLKEIKMYLEENPNSEFISCEIRRLTVRLNSINDLKPEPGKGSDDKNPEFKKILKKWEDENDIPKIKQQLKALKFILS